MNPNKRIVHGQKTCAHARYQACVTAQTNEGILRSSHAWLIEGLIGWLMESVSIVARLEGGRKWLEPRLWWWKHRLGTLYWIHTTSGDVMRCVMVSSLWVWCDISVIVGASILLSCRVVHSLLDLERLQKRDSAMDGRTLGYSHAHIRTAACAS